MRFGPGGHRFESSGKSRQGENKKLSSLLLNVDIHCDSVSGPVRGSGSLVEKTKHRETIPHLMTLRLLQKPYFPLVWTTAGGISQFPLSLLQMVHNDGAWLLTGTRKRDSIAPVLVSLHWLLVKYMSELKALLFVF